MCDSECYTPSTPVPTRGIARNRGPGTIADGSHFAPGDQCLPKKPNIATATSRLVDVFAVSVVQEGRNDVTTKSHPLVERVRGEFNEMPGMQLTIEQASRLWGLDLHACRHVVEVLVESAFLRWTPAGRIARAER
jgi:hypothetical protein